MFRSNLFGPSIVRTKHARGSGASGSLSVCGSGVTTIANCSANSAIATFMTSAPPEWKLTQKCASRSGEHRRLHKHPTIRCSSAPLSGVYLMVRILTVSFVGAPARRQSHCELADASRDPSGFALRCESQSRPCHRWGHERLPAAGRDSGDRQSAATPPKDQARRVGK
jgi:hypothetical protein